MDAIRYILLLSRAILRLAYNFSLLGWLYNNNNKRQSNTHIEYSQSKLITLVLYNWIIIGSILDHPDHGKQRKVSLRDSLYHRDRQIK